LARYNTAQQTFTRYNTLQNTFICYNTAQHTFTSATKLQTMTLANYTIQIKLITLTLQDIK